VSLALNLTWTTSPSLGFALIVAKLTPLRMDKYVFPNGNAAFIKMFIPPDDQANEVYDTLTKFVGDFKHVGEVKRPQPPGPRE
jgi:hypothetical protein